MHRDPTTYQLAEPAAEQTAFCVLVKTKEAKIEWHVAGRSGGDFAEFPEKVDIVAHEIAAGRLLLVCVKDEKRIGQTLVKITYSK